jgi:beta-glucosidase
MDAHQSPDARAGELLRVMTLGQKIQMVHQELADIVGSYGGAGYVPGIPSLCVPPLVLSDAGSGLGDGETDVTSYPAAISQASSWDPALQRSLGASLGSEAHAKGVDVLLAPDVNIARVPLNGRTSEAFGEDPYLSGQTAAAYIMGVQSEHVIATVKHFDANNQETSRATIDEVIAQRTLEEIYQPAFKAAVTEGGAGAVMCSYNKVNGTYACQNGPLLRSDLDGQMGFKGFVMSDWGAAHSTVASALGGLDMEMDVSQEPDALNSVLPIDNPGMEDYYGAPLRSAVLSGKVPLRVLDGMVERILRSMFAVGLFDHPAPAEPAAYLTAVDTAANQAVARQAAEAGSVLLKNSSSVLPLTRADKTIALIGLDAGAEAETVAQAGGSVRVTQPDVVTPLQGLTERAADAGDAVVYYDGANPQVAADLARSSDVAVVYAGYTEEEGTDLTGFGYTNGVCSLTCASEPANSDQLISAVAAANPHTIVVLNTGGPALMPWLSEVSAVVEMWYPGEQDGAAAAALLFGDVDPAGKLPITFPASLGQLPTTSPRQYPGVGGTAVYSEGLLVGYRWYDARHLTPLFPFGYGLSYTTFGLSNLRLAVHGSVVDVTYTITNTGRRAGADVAQVYVSDPPAAGEPPQQLEGYQRTYLPAGRSARVTIALTSSAFSYWSTRTDRWEVAPGIYTIHVGDSSAHEPLNAQVRR